MASRPPTSSTPTPWPRTLPTSRTNPLNDADLAAFIAAQKTFADTAQSWSVDVSTVNTGTFDLSVKNPNVLEAVAHRSPQDIMDEIAALDAESAEVLASIRALL